MTLTDLATWFADTMPESNRAAHRTFAQTCGFFWQPCPLCGSEFGGHEWRDIDGKPATIPDPDRPGPDNGGYRGTAICPACTRAGRGRHPWETQ